MAERITNIKSQVQSALREGDSVDDMTCFWQDTEGEAWEPATIHRGKFRDLPDREYDASWGGVNGPPFIGFTKAHIYISCQYDGSEWVEAIPRNPKNATWIPWPGG